MEHLGKYVSLMIVCIICIICIIPMVIIVVPIIQNKSFFDPYTQSFCNTAFTTNVKSIKTKFGPISFNEKVGICPTYHYLDVQKLVNLANKKSKFVIILDGEPNYISAKCKDSADFIVTTKLKICNDDKSSSKTEYLPYYVTFIKEAKIDMLHMIKESSSATKNHQRNMFCFFAYSNTDETFPGVLERRKFYYKIQEMTKNRVSNWGRCYGGESKLGKTYIDNHLLLDQFKFCIAFENSPILGYVTEKILNPMLAGCIPIYFGAPDINLHFNAKRFINVSDFASHEDCIKYILKVDSDPNLFKSIINEPIFPFAIGSDEFNSRFSYLFGGDFYMNLVTRNTKFSQIVKPHLISNKNTLFVTFADGKKFDTLRICKEAKDSHYFRNVISFDPKSLPNVMLTASGFSIDSSKLFCHKNQSFIQNNSRGYGYWIWKPATVLNALSLCNDGDIVIYADAGCSILKNHNDKMIKFYQTLLNDKDTDMIYFYDSNPKRPEIVWTKQDLFHLLFGSMSNYQKVEKENHLNVWQFPSSVFLCKKTSNTMHLMHNWYKIAMSDNHRYLNNSKSIHPEHESFKENRHDKSIYSLLIKKYTHDNTLKAVGYPLIDVHTATSDPFQRSRMTKRGISTHSKHFRK